MQARIIITLYIWYTLKVWLARLPCHALNTTPAVVAYSADKPTLLTLLKFPPDCLSPHCINIASRIGKEYWKFGLFLLEDDNGHAVDAITCDYRHDGTEMMTLKIVQKWIEGVGRKPVSWNTLVDVLHDVQLNQLASEILNYTQLNT